MVVRWSDYVVHFIHLISDYNPTQSLIEAPVAWSEDLHIFHMTGGGVNLPAIAITIGISLLLINGIRGTTIVNFTFVVIEVIILLIFIFACCKYVDRKNYEPFFPPNEGRFLKIDLNIHLIVLGSFSRYGARGMLRGSTFIFIAFVGFQSITTVAQEAKRPARTLPLGLILSLVISLLIYIGVCTVMVGLVPYQTLNTTHPLTEAA